MLALKEMIEKKRIEEKKTAIGQRTATYQHCLMPIFHRTWGQPMIWGGTMRLGTKEKNLNEVSNPCAPVEAP